MRALLLVPALALLAGTARAELWTGLEDASLPLRSSDLTGFPAIAWVPHPAFEVNGMAAAPEIAGFQQGQSTKQSLHQNCRLPGLMFEENYLRNRYRFVGFGHTFLQ